MNIVFVTSNKGKVATAQKYFNKYDLTISCYDYDFIEPDINDIDFIAETKVLEAYKMVGKPCISLDAGFYIENYPNKNNFPGAFPKRELLDKIGIEGLIKEMKDVANRYCYFKECLAYYDGKELKKFYGISEGTISSTISESDSDQKWSDLWKVFIPKNYSKTLAEMSKEERENRRDNHTSALEEFSKWFKENSKVI
jgi:XTP/dITP diphosphohydrolase